MKLALILGTRPEIIRLSPIMRYLEKNGDNLEIKFFTIHTGQHYDYEMDSIFFQELELPKPDYNLEVGSGSHAAQTNKMGVLMEDILKRESPSASIVYGDTNTTLAGAITSAKLGIPVIHIEAGCRSFDMSMAEEINRICADHVSRLLFPPDIASYNNLIKEGIAKTKIFELGNPLIDACLQNYEIANMKSNVLDDFSLKGEYAVLTLHRAENVDNKEKLERILNNINAIGVKVVFPIHPRTKKRIDSFGLADLIESFTVTKPLGYLDFLKLIGNSKFVLTDSGGVQVESNIIGKPCIVLRDTTEWTEEMKGMSFLVSDREDLLFDAIKNIENGNFNKLDYSKHIGSSKRIIDKCVEINDKFPLKMEKSSMI